MRADGGSNSQKGRPLRARGSIRDGASGPTAEPAIAAIDHAREALAGCLSILESEAGLRAAQAEQISVQIRQAAADRRRAGAERLRLNQKLDGFSATIARALERHESTSPPWAQLSPRTTAAPTPDTQTEGGSAAIFAEPLARANSRVSDLADDAAKLELSNQAKQSQLTHLRTQLSRLRGETASLEQQITKLTSDNIALRARSATQAEHVRAFQGKSNRFSNGEFWQLRFLLARCHEFEAYGERVGYQPSRVLALVLLAEITAQRGVSDEIKAHARRIVDLFDPIYYLSQYPDVAVSGTNPLFHYVTVGHQARRRPSLLFDVDYYLDQAGALRTDPLAHYVTHGVAEGHKPHPLFDGNFYRQTSPDVAADKVNPLFHYQVWGARARRDPSPLFDTQYFLESSALGALSENPLEDYLLQPHGSGADPHPLFSAEYFEVQAGIDAFADAPLVVYQKRRDLWATVSPHPLFDVDYLHERFDGMGVSIPEGMSPLEFFCRAGRQFDLGSHILFDALLYRYQIEEELGRKLTQPSIIDYLKTGYKDKTVLPNMLFDPQIYLNRNSAIVVGPELIHYCLEGDRRGFYCHELFCAAPYNAARTDGTGMTALEHFIRSPSDRAPLPHPALSRPFDGRVTQWIKSVIASTGEVDPDFYRQSHPGLAGLNDRAGIRHYCTLGKDEGRFASPRHLVKGMGLRIRDLPIGFSAEEYLRFNPDLFALGNDFSALFSHYLTTGRLENRSIGRWQFHLSATGDLDLPAVTAPIDLDSDVARVDVCLLMHIFYDDLWPELASFARNFDVVSRDLFINVVDAAWTPRFHREIHELCPDAFVQLSNDNGRDIGGFIRLLDNVEFEKYELFAFMHSKKSPHIASERATHWRRQLLTAFAGSREVVNECVAMFREDPTVGLIASADWRDTDLGDNAEHYHRLLDLFEIDEEHRNPEYVSGTMFMVRSDIVQRLYQRLKDVEWEYGGNKDVEFHRDGQIAHGVERIIGNLLRQMGYRIVWR